METWIHVAEKPSVAREIVSILSQNSRCSSLKSHSVYNPVTQFDFRLQSGNGPYRNVSMMVTSVTGHLMETEFEDRVKRGSWGDVPIPELFTCPIKKSVRKDLVQTIEKNLRTYARKCTHLICWLDCDREGENISFEVIDVCRQANPRIRCMRAQFSGLTKQDIHNAVRNLGEPNKNLSDAVDARSEIDLRVGAAFTRFQTLLFQRNFSGHIDTGNPADALEVPKVVSYGSCQFPTLGFIIERFEERENFVSEDYYKLTMEYKDCQFRWKRGVIYDKLATHILFMNCVRLATDETKRTVPDNIEEFTALLKSVTGKVTNVNARPTRKYRPFPLATVEMQKLASRYLRLPSEKCMALAESLYQEGFISYPRTETNLFNLPHSTLREFVQNQAQCGNDAIAAYAKGLVENSAQPEDPDTPYFCHPKKGSSDDGAHPPIHPLKPFQGFPDDQKTKLFELICRQFLAVCSDDAIGFETIVTVTIGREDFTCRGLDVRRLNWLRIFTHERWSDRVIPSLDVGDVVKPDRFDVAEGHTTPPLNLTEVDLIEKMDKNGIGTDATIAQHIKTIQDRRYVKLLECTEDEGSRRVSRFVPTKLGLALSAVYRQIELHESLFEPRVRANLEQDLALVAKAQKSKQAVIDEAVEQYKGLFFHAMRHQGAFIEALKQFFPHNGPGRSAQLLQHTEAAFPLRTCSKCTGGSLQLSPAAGSKGKNAIRCSSCSFSITLPNWEIKVRAGDSDVCGRCRPETRLVEINFCVNGNTSPPMGLGGQEVLCLWCSPEMMPYVTYSSYGKRPRTANIVHEVVE